MHAYNSQPFTLHPYPSNPRFLGQEPLPILKSSLISLTFLYTKALAFENPLALRISGSMWVGSLSNDDSDSNENIKIAMIPIRLTGKILANYPAPKLLETMLK